MAGLDGDTKRGSKKRGELEVTNTEKVIMGLGFVREDIRADFVSGSQIAVDSMRIDRAIELLKEQEPVEPELEGGGSTWWHVCGECHGMIDKNDNFCRHCGRRIRHEKKAE